MNTSSSSSLPLATLGSPQSISINLGERIQACGKEIGSRVGQNQTTVMRICDRWIQEGTMDHRGRSHPPQCTTSREDQQIVPEWSVRKTSIAWSTLDAEPQTSPPPMV
ncbi:uncharacterized protein TNCV_1999471 [Trichonephila clavipes]|nr:uncharacterized protein TNCV_1999471 [Trichonephila clavipes]